jgi:hypothetical protein
MYRYCIFSGKLLSPALQVSNQTKTIRQRPRVKSDVILATSDVNSTDFLSVMEYNRNFTAQITKDIYIPGFRWDFKKKKKHNISPAYNL